MNHISLAVAGIIAGAVGIAACSALTPSQMTTAQAVVSVIGATVPAAAQVFAAGQLICAGEQGLVAIIDAATGQPYLVTGKPAQAVANVCAVLKATPVPLAGGITQVAGAVVPIPTGS